MDSESSSKGEDHVSRKSRDLTVSLLRSHKNLAEPLTSLGTFGPSGELPRRAADCAPRPARHVAGEDRVGYSCEPTTASTPLATTLRRVSFVRPH
ncbi:hypothetical protein C8J57DRAFT_275692 [Mycena rebaudengoi]|nr:hypothetical protein C8J57DRAFT_275692 [Mycena rebaudengoi]